MVVHDLDAFKALFVVPMDSDQQAYWQSTNI